MSSPAAPLRDRVDACPGALQTHSAADGELARVRVPGGILRADQLRVLATAARELGDGHLELTSRGNVQLRGLAAGSQLELGRRLAAAGLLPSDTHERARNIVASLLSGRTDGGVLDVRPLVRELDAALCADPALAELPGRFLLVLDDGRGDVDDLGADVGLRALGADELALVLAGADSGLRATPRDAVRLVLDAARAFLTERDAQGSKAWRLAELDDGPARVAAHLSGRVGEHGRAQAAPVIGAVAQRDGRTALVGVVRLARLSADALELLARLAPEVQVTPQRSIAVPDLAEDVVDDAAVELFRAGLVFDADSPWARVTACAGRPGCAKSLTDVRGDVTTAIATGAIGAGRQHWVGCARRCGRPAGDVLDVVATPTGYLIGHA